MARIHSQAGCGGTRRPRAAARAGRTVRAVYVRRKKLGVSRRHGTRRKAPE